MNIIQKNPYALTCVALAALIVGLVSLPDACSVTRQINSASSAALPADAPPTSEILRARAPTELSYRPEERVSDEDLWKLISRDHSFASRYYENPRVLTEEKKLLTNPGYLHSINTRAELFLFYIYHELKKRDMPAEFALLPALESGYDPYAYSPVGAVGLWQFTSATGRAFGLNNTWWYSERRAIDVSTKASLNYLRYLHDRYRSWPLVLAAYNAGEGRVNNAIKRNLSLGQPADFWSLDLPKETAAYVPRFIALVKIFSASSSFSSAFPAPVPNRPFWVKVHNKEQIFLTELPGLTGMDPDIFFMLNADQNQVISSPHKDYLLVPASAKEKTRAALAELHERTRTKWIGYQLTESINLPDIGNKLDISTTEIHRFNNVTELKKGGYLPLPRTAEQYARLEDDRARFHILPPRYISKAKYDVHPATYYRVSKEGSVWKISRVPGIPGIPGISGGNINKRNNIRNPRPVYPGQKTLIAAPSNIYEPALNLAADYDREVMRLVYYRVRPDDSLYGIARKFGVGLNELKQWNPNGVRDASIYPGQHIKLYVDVTDL